MAHIHAISANVVPGQDEDLNQKLTYFFFDDSLGYSINGSQFESKRIQVVTNGCKLQRSTPQLVASGDMLDRLAHPSQQRDPLLLVGVQVLQVTHEQTTSEAQSLMWSGSVNQLLQMVSFWKR